jgi:hypothetical protein
MSVQSVPLLFMIALSAHARMVGDAGAPYSAEEVIGHVQTLPDGTRITLPPTRIIEYRDSLGRTRSEQTSEPANPGAQPLTSIRIDDTVSGVSYKLFPDTHTAKDVSRPARGQAPAAPQVRPEAPAKAAVQKQQPATSRESLGTRMIEGIKVVGDRVTRVYPVGYYGNDRPITETREHWRSLELGIMFLEIDSSPRDGDMTRRVTNISRAEPDPSLFKLPPDYKIVPRE